MEIVRIFAIENECLYSVQWDTETQNEWRRLFNCWNDVEYLFDFFEKHKRDLQKKYGHEMSTEDAVTLVMDEAREIEQSILEAARNGSTDFRKSLQTWFKPLDDTSAAIVEFSMEKTRLRKKSPMLRIYAVRLAANVYVVSGGAIKLTNKMNEAIHLEQERTKLEMTKEYLRNISPDADGVFEELKNRPYGKQ